MPRFCPSCGAQMVDTAAPCPACGKEAGQSGGSTPPAPAPSGGGLTDNVAALLCYLPVGPVPLIASIVFLVVEPYKNSKFVRFHAFQSLFFQAALFVTMIALVILGVILGAVFAPLLLIIFPLWMLVGLGALVLFIIMMIKANSGQTYKIPVIGEFAAKQAGA